VAREKRRRQNRKKHLLFESKKGGSLMRGNDPRNQPRWTGIVKATRTIIAQTCLEEKISSVGRKRENSSLNTTKVLKEKRFGGISRESRQGISAICRVTGSYPPEGGF